MSITTLTPTDDDDFLEWQRELDTDPKVPPRRPARSTERRQAIDESRGIRRHRTSEREA